MTDSNKHLRDVERNDKNASKPVARRLNLSSRSKQHVVLCGLSLHLGSVESHKTPVKKSIFQIGTLYPYSIHECVKYLKFSVYKTLKTHTSTISSNEGLALETSA